MAINRHRSRVTGTSVADPLPTSGPRSNFKTDPERRTFRTRLAFRLRGRSAGVQPFSASSMRLSIGIAKASPVWYSRSRFATSSMKAALAGSGIWASACRVCFEAPAISASTNRFAEGNLECLALTLDFVTTNPARSRRATSSLSSARDQGGGVLMSFPSTSPNALNRMACPGDFSSSVQTLSVRWPAGASSTWERTK